MPKDARQQTTRERERKIVEGAAKEKDSIGKRRKVK
jgi:hypothetical protein